MKKPFTIFRVVLDGRVHFFVNCLQRVMILKAEFTECGLTKNSFKRAANASGLDSENCLKTLKCKPWAYFTPATILAVSLETPESTTINLSSGSL